MKFDEVRIFSRFCVVTLDEDDLEVRTTYEEGDLHKPLFGQTVTRNPTTRSFADYSYQLAEFSSVTPRKGRELSVMELPMTWSEFQGLFSLSSTPKLVTIRMFPVGPMGQYVNIYGWIDSAEPVSDRSPESNTLLRWHVDYWLTYADYQWFKENHQTNPYYQPRYASFGRGRVKRGPQSVARPGGYEPRMWLYDSAVRICAQSGGTDVDEWWAVMCRTVTDGNNKVTEIHYYYWNLNGDTPVVGGTSGANAAPTWASVFTGQLEEDLGIDPSAVQGLWVCPFRPWTSGSIFDGPHSSVYDCDTLSSVNVVTKSTNGTWMTDDTHRMTFTDPSGSPMYTAPWGIPFDHIRAWVDVGTAAANICVYLGEGGSANPGSASEGRYFTFPLPSLPITENAWNSYYYTGERDYDKTVREIQKDQAAVNGIAGIGTSAIGGAVAGSMVAPGPGTVAGAIAGIVSGTVGTAVGYVSAGHFDRKTQGAIDKLKSNQTAAMILPAGSQIGIQPPYGVNPGWNMVMMVPDSASKTEIETEQEELGYVTDRYSASCGLLIAGGGGLLIEELEVHGDMNNEGKEYIRKLFARGVHIDLLRHG